MANLAKRLRVHLLVCGFLVLLPGPAYVQSDSPAPKATVERRDGQHDFDFEFGEWKVVLSRRLRPLSGSDTWVEYEGTSVVRRVWNGRANLGELDVTGREGHIEGLSLRLYNPKARQWSITWANSSDGSTTQPMLGEFKNDRGVFYDQETLNGRAIFVRFLFSDIAPKSFRFEQAFSEDGGATWEPNWIAKFTRSGS